LYENNKGFMTDTQPVTDDNVGHRFGGRYEAVEILGQGGLGTVYRGVQVSLQQTVAIKVLKPTVSSDPQVVRRFYNEARIYATLNHPNVVSIHDFGQSERDQTLYLVMEYLPGIDLEQFLQQKGRLEGPLLAQLMIQALQGLAAAHRLNIVHRDLKPANVMILEPDSNRPHVKLLDFGISKIDGASIATPADDTVDWSALDVDINQDTLVGQISGTPHFMSPEQCQAKPLDARSDIYAMGVVLYQVISGELPFQATTPMEMLRKHVFEPPRAFSEIDEDLRVPRLLEDIVMQCLEKNPDARFQTADELLQAMEDFLQENVGKNIMTLEEASVSLMDTGDLPVSRRSFGDEESDRPVEIVTDILKRLGKAYKSFVMYPSNNPIFTTMAQAVKDQLDLFFEASEHLSLSIDRLAVFYSKKKVYEDPDLRTSYPFKMFSDGIRVLTINKGITLEEISGYLDCLFSVSSRQQLHSDLVTLMWEKRFKHIQYLLADDVLEDDLPGIHEIQAQMAGAKKTDYHGKPRGAEGSGSNDEDSPEKQQTESITEALSEADRFELKQLIDSELQADHVNDFIQILTLVLSSTRTANELKALVRIMSQVTQALLNVGDLEHAMEVLKPARATLNKTKNETIRALLEDLIEQAGSEQYILAALNRLDEQSENNETMLVGSYLMVLSQNSISQYVDLLGTDIHPAAQRILMMALRQHCKAQPDLIVHALKHQDSKIVRAVLIVLGELRDPAVLTHVVPMIHHNAPPVRKEASRTLVKLKDPELSEHLGALLNDSNTEVRIAALEGFATAGRKEAVEPLLELLRGKQFVRWQTNEKIHLFRVLSRLGGASVLGAMTELVMPPKVLLQKRNIVISILVAVGGALLWGLSEVMGLMGGIGVGLLAIIGLSFSGLTLESISPIADADRSEQAAYCLERIGTDDAYTIIEQASKSAPAETRAICSRILRRRKREHLLP